jgi:hypothetical protein
MHNDAIASLYISLKESKTIGKIVNAEDSELYKNRSAEGLLKHSPADVATALSTDATSVRVMKKAHKFKEGDLVGARLNINVLKNTGVPVLTLHAPTNKVGYKSNNGFYTGEAKQYQSVVNLKNAYFNVNQQGRENIAKGIQNKFPMASVDGEYVPGPGNFNGIEIKFNPMNHHLFVDENGNAVKSAENVTMYAHRIYARGKIEYHTDDTVPKRKGDSPTLSKLMEQIYLYLESDDTDYRSLHTAPEPEYSAPMHNLTKIYPDDIYEKNAALYYGHYGQNHPLDVAAIQKIRMMRNKPNAGISIYRAVPKDVKTINPGDWVTINKDYAKEHGEASLNNDYKILHKIVSAKHLFNDGGSIQEWGYHPNVDSK